MEHTAQFIEAAISLSVVNEDGKKHGWKPVPLGQERERRLVAAVMLLAESFGTRLDPIHRIDARGELSIVGKTDSWNSHHVQFGEPFAQALNTHTNPQCGVRPGAIMDARSTWCRINHFDAERMVLACAGLTR